MPSITLDLGKVGKHLLMWAVVLMVLAAVFWAYLQPTMVVDLANRFWSCF
ncbi:MAG: hypothetical protein IPG93_19695 [Burkholderiales bacterium]|nr:hypothetical protein [Burkholderiales bacterium]